eukprot:snap_masked-scaffold_14-processed-gene-1.18-mRNA-1 protein AED:0.40 eAED:0.40 QI:0/-1/0/1/-1/1/1/0/378
MKKLLLSIFSILTLCVADPDPYLEECNKLVLKSEEETFAPLLEGLKSGRFPDSKTLMQQHYYMNGVSTTKTGLQYKIVRSHEDTENDSFRHLLTKDRPDEVLSKFAPHKEAPVRVQFKGLTVNENIFIDNFASNKVISGDVSSLVPGLKEGIQFMRTGEIFQFFVPAKLAYGSVGMEGKVEPDADIIFFIHLVEIDPAVSIIEGFKSMLNQPLINETYPFKIYHVVFFFVYGFLRYGLKRFNRKLKEADKKKEKALVKHILFKSDENSLTFTKKQLGLAKKVKEELNAVKKNGKGDGVEELQKAFNKAAKQHSDCPSKEKGGSLGWFGRGSMVKEFEEVVFDPETKEKEIIGPVKTDYGYHLLLIMGRKNVGESKKSK